MKLHYFTYFKPLLLLSIGAIFSFTCKATDKPDSTSFGQVKIQMIKNNDMTNVTGIFVNGKIPKQHLSYEMLFEKHGKSGSSTSQQSGYFNVKANETVSLSSSGINIQPGDNYTIRAKILENNKVVLEVSKIYLKQ